MRHILTSLVIVCLLYLPIGVGACGDNESSVVRVVYPPRPQPDPPQDCSGLDSDSTAALAALQACEATSPTGPAGCATLQADFADKRTKAACCNNPDSPYC